MKREKYGKLAYEAYCRSRGWKSVRGERLPHWEEQDEGLREAWGEAAEAVVAAVSAEVGMG